MPTRKFVSDQMASEFFTLWSSSNLTWLSGLYASQEASKLPRKLRMVYEMVIWSAREVMIVKHFEQSWTEKALYKCSHYYYYYYYILKNCQKIGKMTHLTIKNEIFKKFQKSSIFYGTRLTQPKYLNPRWKTVTRSLKQKNY